MVKKYYCRACGHEMTLKQALLLKLSESFLIAEEPAKKEPEPQLEPEEQPKPKKQSFPKKDMGKEQAEADAGDEELEDLRID